MQRRDPVLCLTHITPIRVRCNQIETAAKQLFNVVKDHNNPKIQDMLDVSNMYCYRNAQDWSSGSDQDEDDTEVEEILQSRCIRFPLVPCCFVVGTKQTLCLHTISHFTKFPIVLI